MTRQNSVCVPLSKKSIANETTQLQLSPLCSIALPSVLDGTPTDPTWWGEEVEAKLMADQLGVDRLAAEGDQ